MKILCGTDIIEVKRIKEAIEKREYKFSHDIFTPKEIEYCERKEVPKYYRYAGRYAAKEAIFKAVSSLLGEGERISWQNAEVINDENGNPKIHFLGIQFDAIQDIDISISHCEEYAVATVVAIVNG